MANKAPGKHFRQGLSTKDFYRMFPDDASAEQWFIEYRWFDGITCPRCGSDNVQTGTAHKTMPFRCRKSKKRGTCGKPFSVKTGTFMEASNLGYQDWLYAMYLVVTNLKSVASMKIGNHPEIGMASCSQNPKGVDTGSWESPRNRHGILFTESERCGPFLTISCSMVLLRRMRSTSADWKRTSTSPRS